VTPAGLPIHRSRERTPGDRGLELGRAQREPIANTVSVYLRLFSEDVGLSRDTVMSRGQAVGERLARVRPDLVEELAGIAAGAGHPEQLLLAVNARTELLAGGALAAGAGECTVAGSVAGECLLAQNWDFHPDLAPSRLLWVVEPSDGRWFATFTEAGVLAKTGLNGAGLAVALNFLATDADGGTDGAPVHVLLRMLLDDCADHDAARRLLGGSEVSASACVTVAAAAALTSYELSPRGIRAVDADANGLLAHTNHFVAAPPAVDLIAAGSGAASSHSRLEQARAGLGQLDRVDPLGSLRELLSSRSGDQPVFCHVDPEEPWVTRTATLATVAYDVAARRMWIRVAGDAAAPLEEVELPVGAWGAAAVRPRPA
jgi:isopenicillin-N N-acyltransferase-like protein